MDNVRQDTKNLYRYGNGHRYHQRPEEMETFCKKNIIVCTHPREEERKEEEEGKIIQHNDNGYVILCK